MTCFWEKTKAPQFQAEARYVILVATYKDIAGRDVIPNPNRRGKRLNAEVK